MTRLFVPVLMLVVGCAHAPKTTSTPDFAALVAATDRTDADRALDPGRKPAEFLAFIGASPGMHVGELMAGGGYTTELLSRAVGPSGTVYGENPKWVLERFAEKPWAERLTRVANVKRLDTELGAPFPAALAGTLDVVVSNAIYHDTVWAKVDRDAMNVSVRDALKPGGAYVVCDSSAKAGSGIADVETLHRIDEQVVRDEVTRAGFTVGAVGDFLRNPDDTRDWSASPGAAAARRGTGDRFCIKFVKAP